MTTTATAAAPPPPGTWNAAADFSSAPSQPPSYFFPYETSGSQPIGPDPYSTLQPVFAPGGGGGVIADDGGSIGGGGAVLASGFPFGWSPLAAGSDGILSVGGDALSSAATAINSVPGVATSGLVQPPPVLPGGYSSNSIGGGCSSDGRNQRGTFVLGSGGHASQTSVLSSGDTSNNGEEVRLSNWSAQSNSTRAPSSAVPASGGGVIDSGRSAAPPSSTSAVLPSRGGASGGTAPRHGRVGGGGGGAGDNTNTNVAGKQSHVAGPNASSNAGRGALSGGRGGRSGRGRGGGAASWRGAGRGNFRRGG
ncbi:hypothetical protein N2W54_001351 [Lotmaria passim]